MIAGPPRQDDENVQAGGDAPEGRWFGNIPTPVRRGDAVRGSSRRDYFQRSELGFMILNSIPLAYRREAGFTSGSLNSCHIGDGW
jgi:hypothetical protein